MKNLILFTLFLVVFLGGNQALAQFGEPEVQEKETPRNLYNEGYTFGFGFNATLSDFGFAGGGQFRLGLNPYTEAVATFKISSLKDPTEQTFIDYFGYQTVPEKYQRVMSIPFYVGLKQRFFAQNISDNFRVYSSVSGGPVFAISYRYFDDQLDNGFRENNANIYGYVDPVYDVLTGWDQSKTHWGYGGEFVVGVDFGEDFGSLQSVQFGYTMNYFSKGIQVLEPCSPDFSRVGEAPINPCDVGSNFINTVFGEVPIEQSNGKRNYFGSAQLSFIFGWMW